MYLPGATIGPTSAGFEPQCVIGLESASRKRGSSQMCGLSGAAVRNATTRGDLYAVVHIDVPGTLTAREKELFEALAKESRFDPRSPLQEKSS